MRVKKNPLTPEGFKTDWAEIKPGIDAIMENYSGDEWFLELLRISRDWTDAELDKEVPQSPEVAIGAVLDPLVKKDYFAFLMRSATPLMRGKIFRLREDLAQFRRKSRLISWSAKLPEAEMKNK